MGVPCHHATLRRVLLDDDGTSTSPATHLERASRVALADISREVFRLRLLSAAVVVCVISSYSERKDHSFVTRGVWSLPPDDGSAAAADDDGYEEITGET